MGACALAFTVLTRLISIAFITMSIFCLPEYKKMIAPDFNLVNDILYVPLLYCEPDEFTVNGNTFTAPAGTPGIGECVAKDTMITAVAGTLCITIFALIIFMIVDFLARRDCCKPTVAAGMGLFVIFILMQSGLEALAFARECMFWEDIYQQIIDKVILTDATFTGRNAETHGNWKLCAGTAVMSFVLVFFVFIDGIIALCNANNRAEGTDGAQTLATDDDNDLALKSNVANASPSNNKPSWSDLT